MGALFFQQGKLSGAIVRIELWHGLLLLGLLLALGPFRLVEPWAFGAGGLFMGVNFLLLSFGVRWALAPSPGKWRRRAAVFFLGVKFLAFLGLLGLVFLRFRFDALSFALGFSTLLVAILLEALVSQREG